MGELRYALVEGGEEGNSENCSGDVKGHSNLKEQLICCILSSSCHLITKRIIIIFLYAAF